MDGVLIINGVADTVARDIHDLAAMPEIEGGEWVEAPPGTVFAGYGYENGQFIAPKPTMDMPAARQAAFETAMAYGNAITDSVVSQYSDAEVKSWDKQEAQARVVLEGGTVPDTSILARGAASKGVSLEDYAAIIVQKADEFEGIAAAGIELRRLAEATLLDPALDTPEKIETAVAMLKEEADSLAASLIPSASE